MKFYTACVLLAQVFTTYALIDLQECTQPYVLETKQIIIPGYPHAFNPSIIRWHEHILMTFRVIPDADEPFISFLYIVMLDHHFDPITEPQLLDFRKGMPDIPSRIEDGRLIMVGEQLYIIYSDNVDQEITKVGYRMHIAALDCDGTQFFITHIESIRYFEGDQRNQREKNWAPFAYNNQLLLAYSLIPHRMLRPLLGTHHAETYVSSCSDIYWNLGMLRGGTPALRDGNHYVAFFHSAMKMNSIQSGGQSILHYFIGAYTYSADVPFEITHVSTDPIIGQNFYTEDQYKPYWKSVQVVFPCGFIMDHENIWLSYGKADHELWVAKIDKKKLYESLVAVPINTSNQ